MVAIAGYVLTGIVFEENAQKSHQTVMCQLIFVPNA